MSINSPTESNFAPSSVKNTDGFTAEEVQSILGPVRTLISESWKPLLNYEGAELASLEPGPRNVTLKGRIVNFYDIARPNKSPKTAQGCLRITLADDTGVITVRLWYAHVQYKVRLGQLVTVWTVHISNNSEHNTLAPKNAPLFTSIFPEGERNCHFMVYDGNDDRTQFKTPILPCISHFLPDLITLRSFAECGHDVEGQKLLVCVKTIGRKKAYLNRNGTTSELISIGIFDDTAEASLNFYGGLCDSALSFQPSKTVLLIWNPGWHIGKSMRLSLNSDSRVDIDPDVDEARRLRSLAQHLKKKDHINPQFPELNIAGFKEASLRPLFTLADVDDFIRSNPTENLAGYLSVIIAKLNIVTPFKRSMLMSNECCGFAIFASSKNVKCERCEKYVALRINPTILDSIIDESGHLGNGKMILSEEAWEQLLGRTPEQLVNTNLDVLQYLEQRLSFLRVTMGFTIVLEDGVGRLAVWCVEN